MKQKSGPGKAPAEQVPKDIRRQTRRQYSAEEKIRIVLDSHHDDGTMRVSHETIYKSLFIQARGVLKKELMCHLRSRWITRRGIHLLRKDRRADPPLKVSTVRMESDERKGRHLFEALKHVWSSRSALVQPYRLKPVIGHLFSGPWCYSLLRESHPNDRHARHGSKVLAVLSTDSSVRSLPSGVSSGSSVPALEVCFSGVLGR